MWLPCVDQNQIIDSRLELFRTQHELARNFYDDHEFCPVYYIENVLLFFTFLLQLKL
jgi:hypothetical protein